MDPFSVLLAKVKQRLDESSGVQEKIVRSIKEIIGVSIQPEYIQVKQGVLTIISSPTVRSMILLKKDVLLKKIQEEGVSIHTIR